MVPAIHMSTLGQLWSVLGLRGVRASVLLGAGAGRREEGGAADREWDGLTETPIPILAPLRGWGVRSEEVKVELRQSLGWGEVGF